MRDPELRAWWREIWGLLVGFLLTFGAALALLIWLRVLAIWPAMAFVIGFFVIPFA